MRRPPSDKRDACMMWFPGDWRKDPGIQLLSLAARGLWRELLDLMWENHRRGYLCAPSGAALTNQQIARLVAADLEEVEPLMAELEAAGVFSRDDQGVIYSRRIVRDHEIREERRKAGAKGGRSKAENQGKVEVLQPVPSKPADPERSKPPSESVANDVAKPVANGKQRAKQPGWQKPASYPTLPSPTQPSRDGLGGTGRPGGSPGSQARPAPPACGRAALRHPDQPPDGVDPAGWDRACALADLVEGTCESRRIPVQGVNLETRALAILGLAEFASKGGQDAWLWIDRTIRGLCRYAAEHPELHRHLAALGRFPDGAYPATDQAGAPSRIHAARKVLQESGLWKQLPQEVST